MTSPGSARRGQGRPGWTVPLAMLATSALVGGLAWPAWAQSPVELLQEEVRGLSELVGLQRRLAEAELEVGRAVREEATIDEALRRARLLFSEREGGLAVAREEVRRRLRALARGGRRGFLSVLLKSRHLSDFRKRRRAMARTLREDVVRIAAYKDELARVLALRTEIGVAQARASKVRQELMRRRDELTKLRQAREATLAELRRRGVGLRLAKASGVMRHRLGRLVTSLRSEARLADSPRRLRRRLPHPVEAAVVVPYGPVREPPFGAVTMHSGWRYGAEAGAEVRAVFAGRVVYARPMRGYGPLVIVDHGGDVHSLSAHLGELRVKEGDSVGTGQVLGTVGGAATLRGAGLYFEIRTGGRTVDPAVWLAPRGEDSDLPPRRAWSAPDGAPAPVRPRAPASPSSLAAR